LSDDDLVSEDMATVYLSRSAKIMAGVTMIDVNGIPAPCHRRLIPPAVGKHIRRRSEILSLRQQSNRHLNAGKTKQLEMLAMYT
jgi:hypothetical protein